MGLQNKKCQKKKFDKIGAMLVLAKIKRPGQKNFSRKEKRYYYCTECKTYHLTSKK